MTDAVPVTARADALPGSRLEELLASYESLKAAAEEASQRFATLTDAIKAEAQAVSSGAPVTDISGAPGLPRLRMSWIRTWRVDVKRLKEERPHTYVEYAVRGGHYELRQIS